MLKLDKLCSLKDLFDPEVSGTTSRISAKNGRSPKSKYAQFKTPFIWCINIVTQIHTFHVNFRHLITKLNHLILPTAKVTDPSMN